MKVTNMRKEGRKKVLIIPDLHFPDHDDKYLEIIYHVLKIDKFDEVIQLGDMLDMAILSSFTVTPDQVAEGMQKELKLAHDFVAKIRALQPMTKIVLLRGNHEYREEKYLLKKAPHLLGRVSYKKDMAVEKYGVEWVDDSYWLGKLKITHGKVVRKYSSMTAKAVYDNHQVNEMMGHTHRMGVYYYTTPETTKIVYEMGCGLKFYPKYAKDLDVYNWQQGFGVGYVDKKSGWFMVVPFPIVNGRVIYKDKVLKA